MQTRLESSDISSPGGRHALGHSQGAVVAAVQHAGQRLLDRAVGGDAEQVWEARDSRTDQGARFTTEAFTGTISLLEAA